MIVVCGIGTGVGKTAVSAILAGGLNGAYWKPIQTGRRKDSDQIKKWVPGCICYEERYLLKTPASPHFAGSVEGIALKGEEFRIPAHPGPLIIELAGGALVPLNDEEFLIDTFIQKKCAFVLTSRHYIGTINHTLLTVEALKGRGANLLGLVFIGTDRQLAEKTIIAHTGLPVVGRIPTYLRITKKIIWSTQKLWQPSLDKINSQFGTPFPKKKKLLSAP
ncbi:MAG: ATP-dependent dethiobiotin synthetase BioD 1 [Chlamydiae bacterium]|nr:ATP-dependent dethiobiotin synthetase BioD 1 [Chlamydiota bacterium]